jgi:long-chain acyl-CoA synthetase
MTKIIAVEKIKSFFDKTTVECLPENLPLLLRQRSLLCPDNTLQVVKNEVGEYEYYSYKRVYNRTVEMACALKKIGVHRGSLVGFIADNRGEWLILDMAVLSLGA